MYLIFFLKLLLVWGQNNFSLDEISFHIIVVWQVLSYFTGIVEATKNTGDF